MISAKDNIKAAKNLIADQYQDILNSGMDTMNRMKQVVSEYGKDNANDLTNSLKKLKETFEPYLPSLNK